ncbi:Gfo/Idh/MocA family oxidoreductase, partial [candidate division WOR-3 bacterium]|nr:Gfo/Idh/MocA family oxidoreductase [candidate division WOR-3 bacterium]
MIKFGVIGVGYLGRHHTRILRDLSDVKLLGIFDINRKRGEEISREFSIPIYDSSDSLIEDADALVIA